MTQSTPPTMPALTPAQQRKLDTISEIVWEIRDHIQARRDARAAQAAESVRPASLGQGSVTKTKGSAT